MTARDADCARLAAAMPGWEYVPEPEVDTTSVPWTDDGEHSGVFRVVYHGVGSHEIDGFPNTADVEDLIYVPVPDAPLPAQLEFVGRLCDAVGVRAFTVESPGQTAGGDPDWWVSLWIESHPFEGHRGIAPDLAHAAVRAAIAAKGAT